MKEKIGIISDTHGLLRPEVLEILKDCKYILLACECHLHIQLIELSR